MSKSERDQLSEMLKPGQRSARPLYIDLEDRGIFREKDLYARLANVEVTQCDCGKVAGSEGSVRFTLDATAEEANVIRTEDQNFGFRLNADAIPWSTSVDLSNASPQITQSKIPEDEGQIIAQIIGSPPPKQYATAPPLYPGITITAHPGFDDTSGRTRIQIDGLSLCLTYIYRADKDPGTRAVRITYSGTQLTPSFYVSARDDRQLQHGFGSFTRIYRGEQAVEVIASPTLGVDRFDGWYRLGQRIATSIHLTVPQAGGSYLYEARYTH